MSGGWREGREESYEKKEEKNTNGFFILKIGKFVQPHFCLIY